MDNPMLEIIIVWIIAVVGAIVVSRRQDIVRIKALRRTDSKADGTNEPQPKQSVVHARDTFSATGEL